MPDEPDRDLDDLDHALFGTAAVPTLTHGAGVGYSGPRFTRTKRVLVALAVVTLSAVAVTAMVSFASGSSNARKPGVDVPVLAKATSTSVALRAPESLPVASTPAPPTTTSPSTTTTRAPTTTTEHVEEPPPTEPETEPPTTEPPPSTEVTTLPPTTSLPPSTT